jgi:hypothetical protein
MSLPNRAISQPLETDPIQTVVVTPLTTNLYRNRGNLVTITTMETPVVTTLTHEAVL